MKSTKIEAGRYRVYLFGKDATGESVIVEQAKDDHRWYVIDGAGDIPATHSFPTKKDALEAVHRVCWKARIDRTIESVRKQEAELMARFAEEYADLEPVVVNAQVMRWKKGGVSLLDVRTTLDSERLYVHRVGLKVSTHGARRRSATVVDLRVLEGETAHGFAPYVAAWIVGDSKRGYVVELTGKVGGGEYTENTLREALECVTRAVSAYLNEQSMKATADVLESVLANELGISRPLMPGDLVELELDGELTVGEIRARIPNTSAKPLAYRVRFGDGATGHSETVTPEQIKGILTEPEPDDDDPDGVPILLGDTLQPIHGLESREAGQVVGFDSVDGHELVVLEFPDGLRRAFSAGELTFVAASGYRYAVGDDVPGFGRVVSRRVSQSRYRSRFYSFDGGFACSTALVHERVDAGLGFLGRPLK